MTLVPFLRVIGMHTGRPPTTADVGGVEEFKITVARSVDPDLCSSLSSESMVLRARRW